MKIFIIVLACFVGCGLSAQQFLGSTRMVTLAMPATNTASPSGGPYAPVPLLVYPVATNDIVEIKTITYNVGSGYNPAQVDLNHSSGTTVNIITNGSSYTGLNSITLRQSYRYTQSSNLTNFHNYYYAPLLVTFTVTSPTNPNSIPANSVVIPADSSGPVNIILESSADLVNWNPALPGTYGTTSTNRFFRVRAERTP